jgi:hypothetical protein
LLQQLQAFEVGGDISLQMLFGEGLQICDALHPVMHAFLPYHVAEADAGHSRAGVNTALGAG